MPISADPVVPGVHRLGGDLVNFYLVEREGGLVLVDAGIPGARGLLRETLAALRRALEDVRAVLLTHGHPDHVGLAEEVRLSGADVWVHAADAPMVEGGPREAMRIARPERSMAGYLVRRPVALRTPLRLAAGGAFSARPVRETRTFDSRRTLEGVPGSPEAVPVPGHTPGSTAYLFPAEDGEGAGVLFTGDALVTHDGLTGHVGPSLVNRGFTHDSSAARASLSVLEDLPGAIVLPGHGAPYRGGPAEAARGAREAGVR